MLNVKKKGKDGGAEKFQLARRADHFKKLSARAEICRLRADIKGQHWMYTFCTAALNLYRDTNIFAMLILIVKQSS